MVFGMLCGTDINNVRAKIDTDNIIATEAVPEIQ